MVPATVRLVSFVVLRLAGFFGVTALDNWNLPPPRIGDAAVAT